LLFRLRQPYYAAERPAGFITEYPYPGSPSAENP
jgi:hypothetical protein